MAKKKYTASVKVMRSYDYNHFEVSLSSDEKLSLIEVEDMRKNAARLVDRAIDQYKVMKRKETFLNSQSKAALENRVKRIKENFPKSEWTPEHKAEIKKLEDYEFAERFDYDDDGIPF